MVVQKDDRQYESCVAAAQIHPLLAACSVETRDGSVQKIQLELEMEVALRSAVAVVVDAERFALDALGGAVAQPAIVRTVLSGADVAVAVAVEIPAAGVVAAVVADEMEQVPLGAS